MPCFSATSKSKLYSTGNDGLVALFENVIKEVDCSVVSGLRLARDQALLFAQGRTMPGPIVTNCDGIIKKSNHQLNNNGFGDAVDVVPYPIDWNDRMRFYHFIGFVRGVAWKLGIEVVSGSDWDNDYVLNDQGFYDLPHWETP
jgi:peptidoglycan L-alanyl-D-glutamate endopeptidase CwlK